MSLQIPGTSAGKVGQARLLNAATDALIALDFDGTLAPIVADPAAARGHPMGPTALRHLAPLVRRVAIITGRPAQAALDSGGLADVPGLVVLGHYGRERWQGGRLTSPSAPPGLALVRDRLPGLLARMHAPEGIHIEDKVQAVAVHVRRTPDPQRVLDLLGDTIRALAREAGLVVEPGRLVLELRAPGADKGGALRAVADELSAADPLSAVVFIGDDLADLAAYDEVDRLRTTGTPGLLICSGSAEVPEVAARADLVVDGPDGVVQWLQSLAQELTRGGAGAR